MIKLGGGDLDFQSLEGRSGMKQLSSTLFYFLFSKSNNGREQKEGFT